MFLQVCRLEKAIEGRSIIAIEQLNVERGEIVALVGPMNSGKSLLLRLLAGILQPGGGSVTLDGRDIYREPKARACIGILFEEDLLYERQTPRQNLTFASRLHRLPQRRVDEVLALVGLSDRAGTRVEKLTPSERRRLAFARVLLPRPELLLLDEPTLRSDWDTQMLFARLVSQVASEGAAVLIACQDLAWSGKFCTRVVELEGGRISADAPHESLKEVDTPTSERLVPYKIPARKDDRIMLFDPGEILYATSRDGKTILRTADNEATTNLTLQELEARLSGRGFFKAHRAYLVNLQHIKAVIQYTRNSYTLQLNDAQETLVPLSKQSEKELQALLGY